MTDRDQDRPSLDDSEFDDFLAELERSRAEAAAPAAQPAQPVPAPQPPAARKPVPPPDEFGFDDDDDGATRVGQIPVELLAALGRKPASEAATVPPPPPSPDDIDVSLDDLEPSMAITVPPPAPVGGLSASVAQDRDDDEVVIEAGADDDEVVIEAGDEEPIAGETALAATPATTPSQGTESVPLLTLTGAEQLRARARTLEVWAAASAHPATTLFAAAELAERADDPETASYLERSNTPEARRAQVRRGSRSLRSLEPGDLGAEVAAATRLREAVQAARSDDEATLSRLLEEAASRTRNPAFARFLTLALARSADRRGDARRATSLRLAAVGEGASTGTAVSIARAQFAQGDRRDALATLVRALGRETDPRLASALRRLVRTLDPSASTADAAARPSPADLADATTTPRASDRVVALEQLAGELTGEAKSLVLTQLASARANLGALEEAQAGFDAARKLATRSALVDAARDAQARKAAAPSRLSPTPAQDEDEAGVLPALGRALATRDAAPETLAALRAALSDDRASRTVDRIVADVAANLGEPNEWLDASRREGATGDGATGLAVTRALVLSRAGDTAAALAQLEGADAALAAPVRALLQAAKDRDAAAAALADDPDTSLHLRSLVARIDRHTSVAQLADLVRDLPDDVPLALRLEQLARAEGRTPAVSTALDVLARNAESEVDRRKFRLLGASGGSAAEALELAPDDPVLLAEALLHPRLPGSIRDRAVEVLEPGSSHIAKAVLRARAATLAELDGSPSDAALHLRAAHDAVPNEPSLAVSVEFAELAAGQPARLAHRFFAAARSESSDVRTRARAFVRLAELDRRERGDTTAALASFSTALELVPEHVPTLRSLEAISSDRSETETLADLESRLAAASTPGRTADAHARVAIRQLFARGGHPVSDVSKVALRALDRGTTSPRLLRWAEHCARDAEGEKEILALEARLRDTTDAADRAEIALRIAAHAVRRNDLARALEAVDEALRADPAHAPALFERAMLLDTGSSRVDAAVAHEAAASVALDTANAVRHWMRAAEHREVAGDLAAARAALTNALARSPDDTEILTALVGLLERARDLSGAIEVLRDRIARGGTPEVLVPLHRRLAQLGEANAAPEIARAAYRELLQHAPDDAAVLRRVAELSLEAGDGAQAAESLMRLARIYKTAEELIWVFLGLGDCYERLIPDPRRAEASHARVLQIDPSHRVAIERIVTLLVRHGRLDEALGRVEAYEQVAHDASLARRLRLSVARGHEAAGDFRSAERLLDDLRRSQPTDVAIQLELARFFEARGGGPPLSMHLTRALADLRRAFEEHPSAEALEAILQILRHRGRPDAVACAEAAATVLGSSGEASGRAYGQRVVGAGSQANSRELDDLLAPRSLPEGTRAALLLSASAIEQAFPFDAKAFHAERVPKESPIRAQALSAAHAFGFNDVVVLVTSAAPRICVPVAATPLTIVIGRELPQITTDAERDFLFARAAKIASAGMAFALRMQPAQVGLTIHALIRAHQPEHQPEGYDPAALDHAAKAIAKHLPKDQHERAALCIEMGARTNFEPQRIGLAAAELGDRVALVSTGLVHAAIGSVVRLAGRDLESVSGFDARLALVRSMPEAWGLLLFALSDAHAEARHRAGIPA